MIEDMMIRGGLGSLLPVCDVSVWVADVNILDAKKLLL